MWSTTYFSIIFMDFDKVILTKILNWIWSKTKFPFFFKCCKKIFWRKFDKIYFLFPKKLKGKEKGKANSFWETKRERGERETVREEEEEIHRRRERNVLRIKKRGRALPASTIDFAMKVTSLKYQDLLILKLISLWSLHYLNIVFLTKQ